MEENMTAKIFTFYSYKGGVGRSMALANIAWLLATRFGKRVLAIDWDLEAPGLHRFFDIKNEKIKAGLIDLFYDYKELLRKEHKTFPEKLFRLEDYIINIQVSSSRGKLSIVTAGKQNNNYSKRVNDFNWQSFYKDWYGYGFIQYLKMELKKKAEIILVDSRTGVTDIGGICTLQLPDTVILMFATNDQNLKGIEYIARSIVKNAKKYTDRKAPPQIIFKPSRVDRDGNLALLQEWQNQATRKLKKYMTFDSAEEAAKYIEEKIIPYVGDYSYRETPLVVKKFPRADLSKKLFELVEDMLKSTNQTHEPYVPAKVEKLKDSVLEFIRTKRTQVSLIILIIIVILLGTTFYAERVYLKSQIQFLNREIQRQEELINALRGTKDIKPDSVKSSQLKKQ